MLGCVGFDINTESLVEPAWSILVNSADPLIQIIPLILRYYFCRANTNNANLLVAIKLIYFRLVPGALRNHKVLSEIWPPLKLGLVDLNLI